MKLPTQKVHTIDALPRDASPSLVLKAMAGRAEGRWWYVWVLGRPNPLDMNKQARYYVGMVEGSELKIAVARARARWVQHRGNMEIEEIPKR